VALAFVYGVVASGALVIGAVLGVRWTAPPRLRGTLLAFAAGALISALAFELFAEAVAEGGLARSAIGLLVGAVLFVGIKVAIDARIEHPRIGSMQAMRMAAEQGLGLTLLLGVLLDGIPESAALGVSLAEEQSLALLVAVFVSNLPEALVGSNEMKAGGWSPGRIVLVWSLAAILLTAVVVAGSAWAESISPNLISVLLSLAGGAVLASLASTVMPEAYDKGKPWNALATAAGFLLSFALAGG
jgi:zinc transporter, ZIP family